MSQCIRAAALCVALTAMAATPARAADAPDTKTIRLSDERTLSRWAHPVWSSDIYRTHSASSKKVGRLRFFTEDGFPEVYLLLRQHTDKDGERWVQIRIPKRPNGRVGWVNRDKLGQFRRNVYQLSISRKRFRAVLRKKGKKIWAGTVGGGARGTATPAGRFYIREKFRFKNTPVYGTRAIGTSAYAPTLSDWPGGGVVGIHGTDQPQLIPGRPSHGCVRLKNRDVERLYRLLPIGTPLRIT
jgi:hypothetical protein